MKLLIRLALTLFFILVLVKMGGLWWLLFYRGDLPDIALLAKFAPDTPGIASDPCFSRPITVVPAREIAAEIRAAIKVEEPETRIPFQVTQSLVCGPKRQSNLRYVLDQYRLTWRVRSRFTEEQLLTIYMNRVYLAHDTFGVADASRHFFGRKPKNLSLAEAALLVGMIRSPARFSPYENHNAALERRNQVIEAMLLQGRVSAQDALRAKAAPLVVLSHAAQ